MPAPLTPVETTPDLPAHADVVVIGATPFVDVCSYHPDGFQSSACGKVAEF